jgi:serine/threonine protein kinase
MSRGTASYRAPELVKGEKYTYSNKVDIWSMGCILYELAFQKKVFEHDMLLWDYLRSGHKLELPTDTDLTGRLPDMRIDDTSRKILAQVIGAMLETEPSKRSSAQRLGIVFSKALSWSASTTVSVRSPTLEELRSVLAGEAALLRECNTDFQMSSDTAAPARSNDDDPSEYLDLSERPISVEQKATPAPEVEGCLPHSHFTDKFSHFSCP